jgi:uncharacterized membrane protein YraQ (UPF0718 family)
MTIVLKVLMMKKITNNKVQSPSFAKVLKQSAIGLYKVSPMIIGVLGLSALLLTFVPPEKVKAVFTGNPVTDTLFGTLTGGVMVGNAMVSYILGGELLKINISMYAVTAFLLAWVSIGYVQIPMEISFFGKRFTLIRNLLAIIFTLIISILIVVTYENIR